MSGILTLRKENLGIVTQRDDDPLCFDFLFQPDDPTSQELKEWFDYHGVSFFVAEWGRIGEIEHGGVSFRGRPDLAALFKLRFL